MSIELQISGIMEWLDGYSYVRVMSDVSLAGIGASIYDVYTDKGMVVKTFAKFVDKEHGYALRKKRGRGSRTKVSMGVISGSPPLILLTIPFDIL